MFKKFAQVKCAIDILRGRLPGALAMLKAHDVAVMVKHKFRDDIGCENTIELHFFYDGDAAACGTAYRAIERLYEMDRDKRGG